jgi:hypothetical protein
LASDKLYPSAKRILRFVSIRQGIPCSMRVIVMGETLASLASSDLLIKRDSRTFLRRFLAISLLLPIRDVEWFTARAAGLSSFGHLLTFIPYSWMLRGAVK